MEEKNAVNRRNFLRILGAGALGAWTAEVWAQSTAQRPNFVFMITDDISWDDLGCYGNTVVKTPNLDKMAERAARYENFYLTASSCSPSRCSIVTGRYPHNTGAPELHTELPLDQITFPELLRKAGYYTCLSGKNHMGDVTRAFETISKGRGPGKEEDWVRLLQGRPKDQPFFFWFASTDAHRNWNFDKNAPRYTPDEITPPPFLYDGPKTREDMAGYYHEISRADYYVGQLIEELEKQGVMDHTYFVFCSDNGRPFPRCKTRCYDSGMKSPFLVYAPGRVKPAVSDALVSAIDLAPTFLGLAGVKPDPAMQGVSLKPLLDNPQEAVRDYVFSEHNWHVFQAHERMVRSKNWMYIRNAWPERQNLCVESIDEFPAGEELWAAEAEGKLKPEQRDVFLKPRPAEELYDLANDPNQFNNLAADPAHQETLAQMRALLDRWTEETCDTVPDNPTPDRSDLEGNKNPDFKVGEFPGAAKDAPHGTKAGPVRAQ